MDNNTPPAAMPPNAAEQAWDKVGKPKFDRDRYAIFTILSTISTIAMAVAIIIMLPLKTVTPYIISAEESGKTTAIGIAHEGFNPTSSQVMYATSEWIKALWSIDSTLSERNLAKAYEMTRGKAADVFRQHMSVYKPIERSLADRGLSSSVDIKTINPMGEGTSIARFSVTERKKDKEPVTDTYMMTLHWIIIPPSTTAEIYKNPIGFFITDFTWTKEVSAQ